MSTIFGRSQEEHSLYSPTDYESADSYKQKLKSSACRYHVPRSKYPPPGGSTSFSMGRTPGAATSSTGGSVSSSIQPANTGGQLVALNHNHHNHHHHHQQHQSSVDPSPTSLNGSSRDLQFDSNRYEHRRHVDRYNTPSPCTSFQVCFL